MAAPDATDSLTRCLAPLEWPAVQQMVRARAATLLGEREADRLVPSGDPVQVADERARTVECLRLLGEAGRLPLAALKDPDPLLKRLGVEGARLEGQDVYDLCRILQIAQDVREFLREQGVGGPVGVGGVGDPEDNPSPRGKLGVGSHEREPTYPLLMSLALALPDLSGILREVADHVTPNGQLQDSASPDLKKIRRRISHLSEKLQRELQTIIDKARSEIFLRDEYITVRNGRYVLPIRTDAPFPVAGVLHGRSSTGLTHFVEPMVTVEINNEIVGLREREEEEIDRILRRYTRLLRDARSEVQETVAGVGRFDGIQARARLGEDLRARAAEPSDDGTLRLEQARHPLLEESLRPLDRSPVPIGLSLNRDYPVLIVSGPNTGGKTVALKTVGLLVLMNQAGLLVPAENARLPVFRRVLVDIGDHQSIAANLSTFSSHMQNIGSMARDVEPPALVLLDEIGTGTDPEEGAALGVAILRHFHARGAFVMVTTHMSGIKSYGYETPGVKNACVEFDEETLQPTFRLLLGVAGSSSGIEIARRLGLPDSIVADARELIGPDSLRTDAYLKRVKETLDEVSREREQLLEERREAERVRTREQTDSERREKDRAREFREELAAAVDRYEKALRQHLSGIDDKALRKKLEKEGKRKAAGVEETIEREARDRFGGPQRPVYTPPSEVAPGDRVRIVALAQKGIVSDVDGDRIRVDVGGKTLAVALLDLALLERVAGPEKPRLPKQVTLNAPDKDQVGGELRLLGHSVDEALPKVDKFLDDAFLAGHTQVRLVHGHGTGALRQAIAGFLKEHPHVANYHLADDRQGGTGVTVVDLRK